MNRCTIDLSQVYGVGVPVQPDYGDPNGPPYGIDLDVAWSILIFNDGVGYEFKWFYAGQSMEITSTYSQRGEVTFRLHDYLPERSIMPFIPIEEMPYEIWNESRTHQYAAGFLKAQPEQKMEAVRDDLTECAEYTVRGTDLYEELERNPVYRVYTGKTLGFILRDVLTRDTGLDASEIDASLGFVVETFPIKQKYPSQILNQILALLDATYWIEPATRKIRVSTKGDSGVRLNTVITDDNVYDYFDSESFRLGRQTDQIRNRIAFSFTQKYNKGTVNVGKDNVVVNGYGDPPTTAWDGLKAPLQFKLAGAADSYSVEENLSSGVTQELRLSSAYKGDDATNQAYELRGQKRQIFVTNEESIGLMRRARGDSGLFTYVVSEDNNFFTVQEARRFAQALLALSKALPEGQGTTFNEVFQELPLAAGMVLPFNLPQSRRFTGEVVIQQLTLRDLGGEVEIGGVVHPYLQIDMVWTATLTSQQAQLRKMMQSLRAVSVDFGEDDKDFEDYAELRETLVLKDCIHENPSEVGSGADLLLGDSFAERGANIPTSYTELDFAWGPWGISFSSD